MSDGSNQVGQEKLFEGLMTYEATTHAIRVSVQSFYMNHESDVDRGYYFWGYRVEIANIGSETAQLLNRHWIIIDAKGKKEEVVGAGVIGEQPILAPGERFTYTSGCPLSTPSGFMKGSYEFIWQSGPYENSIFQVEIPAFSLDSPYVVNAVN
ncbi:Co2+/Mg2+ efflux protein ApaG [Temperatibacter marinus]|uniref:Protein ApaG n=1 Tax=Temperatibacter marinus TaxID=1456591 RepID=A0AA52EH80_9PROT|nr:Co2+/Mg2+ efflux protein ApaG [Temperatibacter marinus]WND03613.1 Co2+/Mg2+ efflux protein ApaG [Temperatibacter marinus]